MIGYCRVPTVEEADSGHSIDAQRAAIPATAETRGWETQWVEEAASAKDLDRPGLSYALSMLGSGHASGIVVSRLDRLSRSVHDLAILLKRARAQGNVRTLITRALEELGHHPDPAVEALRELSAAVPVRLLLNDWRAGNPAQRERVETLLAHLRLDATHGCATIRRCINT